jgi:hypothetical protein
MLARRERREEKQILVSFSEFRTFQDIEHEA